MSAASCKPACHPDFRSKIKNLNLNLTKSIFQSIFLIVRPLILRCPSCEGDLTVTSLGCADCSINIDGEFELPRLLKLTRAQIDFIEVFIKNRGIIREVERELGVSYPTVRARLDEVIHALGYSSKPASEDETANDGSVRRRVVLGDLKAGKLTPEEALAALNERGTKND